MSVVYDAELLEKYTSVVYDAERDGKYTSVVYDAELLAKVTSTTCPKAEIADSKVENIIRIFFTVLFLFLINVYIF